jgi:GT2 family glycosyltransferase
VLRAVLSLSSPPDELLVIDDGSTDDSADLARELGATVIEHGDNRGLAAARNTALEHARGELVLFLDADAVPTSEIVRLLGGGLSAAGPGHAAAGGQLVEPPGGELPDRWRALFWRQTQGSRSLDDAPFVVGGCCCLRRRTALELGGFDPRFRTNGEDVELSARLRRSGLRLLYEPRAEAVHLRRDDLASLLRMVFRHSRDHVRALRSSGQSGREVIRNAARWGPVTLVSSLRRHRSLGLAALSPLCYGASLAGCAAGALGV